MLTENTQVNKGKLLYSGKAKSVYATDDADQLWIEFRDDTSAFNGQKLEKLARKGEVNNRFNSQIMTWLAEEGVSTHFIRQISPIDSLVRKLEMIPVECVVRNCAAGSLVKRLGLEEGLELDPPVFELFLKSDALGDPMINEDHALRFGWARQDQLHAMKAQSLRVNGILKNRFAAAGMILVDFKLEFGMYHGELLLGDEFSPDGCRVWDAQTRKKLDKDRFRQGLGDVVESYEEIAHRLGIAL